MKKFSLVILIFIFSSVLIAESSSVGLYDSMAGAGISAAGNDEYVNIFLSQRGTLFKINSNDIENNSNFNITHTQLKAEGKYYCWSAFTTLNMKGETLTFASCDDNKLCFTDNILSFAPDLKIIAEIYDSISRPVRIEQIAAIEYNKQIYLFVMTADHEIYQGVFDQNKNSKVKFSILKYNKEYIYGTSLNAIVNSHNVPIIYIKQTGIDNAGSLLEYNFITKQGIELKNINGSRILVVQDGNDRIIYYGAGLTLKNTYNKNNTFKVNSNLGSYIPVITVFYSGKNSNIAIATDYSNVVVVNKELKTVTEFSLTKKKKK